MAYRSFTHNWDTISTYTKLRNKSAYWTTDRILNIWARGNRYQEELREIWLQYHNYEPFI